MKWLKITKMFAFYIQKSNFAATLIPRPPFPNCLSRLCLSKRDVVSRSEILPSMPKWHIHDASSYITTDGRARFSTQLLQPEQPKIPVGSECKSLLGFNFSRKEELHMLQALR